MRSEFTPGMTPGRVIVACAWCGDTFAAFYWEDRKYCTHAHASAAVRAAHPRPPRVCAYCGAVFYKYIPPAEIRRRPGSGKYCCPEHRILGNRNPRVDGDKRGAINAVNRAVRNGVLPVQNETACVDCGKLWQPGEPRHEYDHYLGYAVANWLQVQCVCPACHRARGSARGEQTSVPMVNARRAATTAKYGPYPRACSNCGRVFRKPGEGFSRGRCRECTDWLKRTGEERPPERFRPELRRKG